MTGQQPARPSPPPRRRRAFWLAITAPLVLVLVVTGAWFIALPVRANMARSDYDAKRYSQALAAYRGTQGINPIEPWKAYYNAGTSQLRIRGQVPAAIASLETAYRRAAPASDEAKCRVQTNLSTAYEVRGDELAAKWRPLSQGYPALVTALQHRASGKATAEDLAVISRYTAVFGTNPTPSTVKSYLNAQWDTVEKMYENAKEARRRPGCPQSSQDDSKQKQQQKKDDERQQQKKDDAKKQRPQDPKQSPSPNPSPNPTQSPNPSPSPNPTDSPTPSPSPSPSDSGQSSNSPTPTPTTSTSDSAEEKRRKELEEQNRKAEDSQEQDEGTLTGGGGGGKNW